ncbi:MAG: hypothetical protein ACFBSC_07525 [Microcoleaceae cyanobacterium]
MLQVNLLPGAVNEILASVADTYCLTESDRYGLMAAILSDSLTREEYGSIDRLLRSVRRGTIKVK